MKHSIIFSIAKPLFSPFKHKKWFKGFLISVVPKFGSVNLKDLAWIEANWGVKIIYTYYEIEQLEREYKKKSQRYFSLLWHAKSYKKFMSAKKTTIDWRITDFTNTFPFNPNN